MNKASKQQQQVFAHRMGSQVYAPSATNTTTTTMPTNFAQTISRSNNLHQQIFGHHHHHHHNNNNYDQPIIHHQLYANHHQHPMSSMTLASRPPKERQPLPLHLTNPAAYQHHHQQRYHQTLPSKARFQAQHQIYQEPVHQSNQQHHPHHPHHHHHHHHQQLVSLIEQQARLNKPLCRCRVMYLGSSVPHITKNGLHGIQEPLRHLYPEEQFSAHSLTEASAGHTRQTTVQRQAQQAAIVENTIDISHLSSTLGIDSWLSVWSNGLLLENVDEFGRDIKRFFSIESLHYCAAVRYFDTTTLMKVQPLSSGAGAPEDIGPEDNSTTVAKTQQAQDTSKQQETNNNNSTVEQKSPRKGIVRFLPLDAPIFQCPGMLDANHPPVFGAIMRRTTGIKVLECHAFICRRDAAANALVRCCTHAYADFLSAKRLSVELGCSTMPQTGAYAYYAPSHELRAPSKTQRSSSLGRKQHNPSQGAPYQVVEAIINQAAVHKPPTKGSSHSSGGRASNETDDNSLENSSHEAGEEEEEEEEENYAIIAKQQQQLPQQQQQQQKPNNRRDQSSRHAHRKVKGSSKSLFNDFQPLIRDDHLVNYDNQQPVAVDRLSHSLDYLQCCQLQHHQQQQRMSATHNNRQSEDFNDENMVSYSIVKNKRHSRSMHNLDGPFEFCASQATARPSTATSRGRSRTSNRPTHNRYQRGSSVCSATAADRLANKKAASFQDMSALRRKGSISSQATVHSNASHKRPGQVEQAPNGAIYDTCSIGQHSPAEQEQSNVQDYPRILKAQSYLPTSGTSSKTTKMGASAKSSSSSSSNNHHHHHRRSHKLSSKTHLNDDTIHSVPYPMMEQQHNTLGRKSRPLEPTNFYAQPFNVASYVPAPHPNAIYQSGPGQHHAIYMGQAQPAAPPPPPAPLAPHPYYMSPTGAYHHHHHPQPIYHPANQMYDQTQANYHLAAQLAHPYPDQCHTLNQIAASRAMFDNGMATIGASGRTNKKSSLKSASASLATRFRCLSPPVNFLTSNNNNNRDKKNKRDSHVEDSARTSEIYLVDRTSQQLEPTVANISDGTIADGPQPLINGQQNHLANGEQPDEASSSSSITNGTATIDVVSGQPGFIQQKQHNAQSQPAKAGGKKLSWIKRLSLTMSSNGQHSGDDISNSGTISSCNSHRVATSLSTDPCGSATTGDQQQQQQQMTNGDQQHQQPADEAKQAKQKRKRSSFFGGSLTLGRSSNKSSSSKPSVVPQPT